MTSKDFLTCILLSFVVMFAAKFMWKWFNGGFNTIAIMEWMNRGFSFGIDLSISFILVILVFKLVVGGS